MKKIWVLSDYSADECDINVLAFQNKEDAIVELDKKVEDLAIDYWEVISRIEAEGFIQVQLHNMETDDDMLISAERTWLI